MNKPPVEGVGPRVVAAAPAPVELYDHVVSAFSQAPAAHDTHSIDSFESQPDTAPRDGGHHPPLGYDHAQPQTGAGPAVLPARWAETVAQYAPGTMLSLRSVRPTKCR